MYIYLLFGFYRSKQINITFWDKYAQQFAYYLKNNKQTPMVVVIQYEKISYYRGLFNYSDSQLTP